MSTRLRVRPFVLVPALLLAAALRPGLARAGFWTGGDARAELAEATARGRGLAERDDVILRRIAIKEDLAAALIAGRADLAEVAARFLELNAADPAALDLMRATAPGDTDLERAARNAIDYAATRVADPAAFRRRLEAELARMQAVCPAP